MIAVEKIVNKAQQALECPVGSVVKHVLLHIIYSRATYLACALLSHSLLDFTFCSMLSKKYKYPKYQNLSVAYLLVIYY